MIRSATALPAAGRQGQRTATRTLKPKLLLKQIDRKTHKKRVEEESEGWLHVWKWPSRAFPNGSIILLQASHELAVKLNIAAPLRCPKQLIREVEKIHDFKGMVYVMRDKSSLDAMKIGKATDAHVRMAQSPWSPQLGRTTHADRSEELVMACVGVPSSLIERQLHAGLGPPALDIGRGREWFRSDLKDLVAALKKLTRDEGDRVWIWHDGTSSTENARLRSLILPGANDLPATFAEVGQIVRVYSRPYGFDVVSSVWCSVRYYLAENNIPMPYYSLPNNLPRSHLETELRSFLVDVMIENPWIIREGDKFSMGGSYQRLNKFNWVGSVILGHDPMLDVTRDEWEFDGEIYEVVFCAEVVVLETFHWESYGQLRRRALKQIV